MPLCTPACAVNPVAYGTGACRQITRPGGIYKFLFLKCSVAVPAMTLVAFQALIDDGTLVASGKVLAGVGKGTDTKTRTNSCDPERLTGRTEIVTFQDFNADFWNDKMANQDRLLFGYTTCDELVYGFSSSYSLSLFPNRPQISLEPASIDGTIELTQLELIKPTKIAGINAILQATESV
jgi:hypothetical protein